MQYDHFLRDRKERWEDVWVYRAPLHEDETLPLLVPFVGAGSWTKGGEFSRSSSRIYGVEYVVRGNVVLVQEGKRYLINPGEVYLLRENVTQVYTTGPAGMVLKRYLSMRGPCLTPLLQALNLWGVDVLVPVDARRVERLLKQATTLLQQHPVDITQQLSATAYRLLLELARSVKQRYPVVVEKCLEYMHRNLHKPLHFEELGRFAGYSASHLSRLFTKHLHCSPMRYFQAQRIAWTAFLLEKTQFSVKEIAYKAGFENPYYLSSQFKQHFGMSPTDYRRTRWERKDI